MKIAVFWMVITSFLAMVFSSPRYPEWFSMCLDVLCFVNAIVIYTEVVHTDDKVDTPTEELNFKLTVALLSDEDEILWEYIDNVVPFVGHKVVLKTERGVETYLVCSVFQSQTRNVEVYVELVD